MYWVFTVFVALRVVALQVNSDYLGTYIFRIVFQKKPQNLCLPVKVGVESIYEFQSESI